MNNLPWVKITPETELPKDTIVLIGWIISEKQFFSTGILYRDSKGIVWADLARSVSKGPTHYCIITPPTE